MFLTHSLGNKYYVLRPCGGRLAGLLKKFWCPFFPRKFMYNALSQVRYIRIFLEKNKACLRHPPQGLFYALCYFPLHSAPGGLVVGKKIRSAFQRPLSSSVLFYLQCYPQGQAILLGGGFLSSGRRCPLIPNSAPIIPYPRFFMVTEM